MWGKYNLRQGITVWFIFCKPTDNFDVGVDSWVFILADFCKALCSLFLSILATYAGSAIWWKKADLNCGGGKT
jgi:hypothetical protein